MFSAINACGHPAQYMYQSSPVEAVCLLCAWERDQKLFNSPPGKLLKDGEFFLTITEDDPYFSLVFWLERQTKINSNDWSPEDELVFRGIGGHAKFSGCSHAVIEQRPSGAECLFCGEPVDLKPG